NEKKDEKLCKFELFVVFCCACKFLLFQHLSFPKRPRETPTPSKQFKLLLVPWPVTSGKSTAVLFKALTRRFREAAVPTARLSGSFRLRNFGLRVHQAIRAAYSSADTASRRYLKTARSHLCRSMNSRRQQLHYRFFPSWMRR